MSKRSFGTVEALNSRSFVSGAPRISKKFKNSLDSDEEDDEDAAEKQNTCDPEDFEGQEDSTIDHDGEIKITPFNMKDELEEGHFDKDGTFIFDRNKDEIRDQWLDDIDWVQVKYRAPCPEKHLNSSDSEDISELDKIGHYKKMLELMKPSESVQAAIRRLGGSTKSRKEKKPEKDHNVIKEQIEKMHLLTGFANDIIQNGDMDIYEQTYERLSYLVESSESSKALNIYDGEASDMFGETFEESSSKEQSIQEETLQDSGEEPNITWEFKWENKDDSPVYGPHSTQEMLQWVQEGYFSEGVYVRKIGNPDSPFYTSKRIDFELYI